MSENNQSLTGPDTNQVANQETTPETKQETNQDIMNFDGNSVSPISQRPPFTTTLIEKISAFLIWIISFFYIQMLFTAENELPVYLGVFTVSLLALTLAMFWKRKWTWESIAFLVLTILVAVSCLFDIGAVWEQAAKVFFLHLFVVYFILCRSGRLAEGETSHLFLWDGITGFFVMPFKNFILNVRTIISCFKKRKDGKKNYTLVVILAVIVGIILFSIAISCLRNADDNYRIMLDQIGGALKIKMDADLIGKIILTIPVAMYLYGLLGGCYRETEPQVQHRGDNIKKAVAAMAKVPSLVWLIFIALFSVFYLVFFLLQGSYLFGAFRMILPEQYTFAEYARKGFGETCGIMAVNLMLIWLAVRTSEKKAQENGKNGTSEISQSKTLNSGIRIACGILLGESILFAIIALMKLIMYINAYGFTPLRLESFWLVLVLLLACICILISMFAGKKTARVWFMAGAASLAILCLFPFKLSGNTRIDYKIQSDSIEVEDTSMNEYVNPNDEYDFYSYVEIDGRKYLPYGTQGGTVNASVIGKCIAYESDDNNERYYEVNGNDDLIAVYYTDSMMGQFDFWRAEDTMGEEMETPDYVYDLGYEIWQ